MIKSLSLIVTIPALWVLLVVVTFAFVRGLRCIAIGRLLHTLLWLLCTVRRLLRSIHSSIRVLSIGWLICPIRILRIGLLIIGRLPIMWLSIRISPSSLFVAYPLRIRTMLIVSRCAIHTVEHQKHDAGNNTHVRNEGY